MIFNYILFFGIFLTRSSWALRLFPENLLDTPMQDCLNCLCYARTGCWNRLTCASYSIDQNYWQQAGSPARDTSMNDVEAFQDCMGDENCILNTLKLYTESYGENDCNYDGKFDCKDRFAIHLMGKDCYNPSYGKKYSNNFNECADDIGVDRMEPKEGRFV